MWNWKRKSITGENNLGSSMDSDAGILRRQKLQFTVYADTHGASDAHPPAVHN